jgi:hypothetical protein
MKLFNFPMGRLCQWSCSPSLIAIAIGVSFYTFAISKAIASETVYFQVPSGNIHCGTDGTYLDCEMGTSNATLPPKPKSCNLDWGNRFVMSPNGAAERACHGDTLGRNPKHPILSYGKTWRKKGFTCISKTSGLTCKNVDGRGWTLSKNKQQLF